MSEKQIFTLRAKPHPVRQVVCERIMQAPDECVVTISPPTRKLAQNSKMWAMLTDLSRQIVWHGLKLSPEDWKCVLSASLHREMRTVPNVDGNGLVVLGMRTSQMSVRDMSELIELIYAFGSTRDVVWSEVAE